ncbi:hypothetical protein NRS6134_21960 (plasmid) [Bacillus subtilis]|nr:hypothetical protein NRS6134_04313 [Bacillus subtilis]CAI6330401.1 hypothetical protein NRS6134_21960 [Bacillus subtilis]CAI6332334.1 hypothetical protein NRS6131_22415 [Bacillus subtilis]
MPSPLRSGSETLCPTLLTPPSPTHRVRGMPFSTQLGQVPSEDKMACWNEGLRDDPLGSLAPEMEAKKRTEQGRVTRLTLFSPLGFYGRQWAILFARLTCGHSPPGEGCKNYTPPFFSGNAIVFSRIATTFFGGWRQSFFVSRATHVMQR